jgi:hypothetical protein
VTSGGFVSDTLFGVLWPSFGCGSLRAVSLQHALSLFCGVGGGGGDPRMIQPWWSFGGDWVGSVSRGFSQGSMRQAKGKGLLVGRRKVFGASHTIGEIAIPSTVGLLRQGREKVLRVIGEKYPICAKKLGETYILLRKRAWDKLVACSPYLDRRTIHCDNGNLSGNFHGECLF